MVAQLSTETTAEIIYPERASAPQGGQDGQPMSDNTKQFRWIVTIKENLELLFGKIRKYLLREIYSGIPLKVIIKFA